MTCPGKSPSKISYPTLLFFFARPFLVLSLKMPMTLWMEVELENFWRKYDDMTVATDEATNKIKLKIKKYFQLFFI
jgi:hypothetical protein